MTADEKKYFRFATALIEETHKDIMVVDEGMWQVALDRANLMFVEELDGKPLDPVPMSLDKFREISELWREMYVDEYISTYADLDHKQTEYNMLLRAMIFSNFTQTHEQNIKVLEKHRARMGIERHFGMLLGSVRDYYACLSSLQAVVDYLILIGTHEEIIQSFVDLDGEKMNAYCVLNDHDIEIHARR